MGKNIIDFIIKFGLQGLPLVVDACKKVASAWTNIVTVIKSATSWVGKFKGVLSNLFVGFGTLASIISLAISAWQMFKNSASEAAESAKAAAKKASDAWKNAKDAVLNYRREAYLKDKPTVDLRALDESIARHERILQLMRDEASFAAKMREMEARAKGNERAAEQAKLDGALARGEMTDREHKLQTRRLEDQEREERQKGTLAPLQAEAETAKEAFAAAREDGEQALALFEDFRRSLEKFVFPGNNKRFVGEDGKTDPVAFLNLIDYVHNQRASAQEDVKKMRTQIGVDTRWAKAHEHITTALMPLVRKAQELGIDVTMDGRGYLQKDGKELELADFLKQLQPALEQAYTDRKKKVDDAIAKQGNAARAKKKADETLKAAQEVVVTENQTVAAKREQEDKTEAHRKREEAKKKEEEAKAKKKEAEDKERRHKLEAARDMASEEETRHKEAAATARSSGGMHLERVIDNAGENTTQKAGWEALQRLLRDAQNEPEILKALSDFVKGRSIKASGKMWTKGRHQDMKLFAEAYRGSRSRDKEEVTSAVLDYAREAEETRLAERSGKRSKRESTRLSDMDASARKNQDAANNTQIDTLHEEAEKVRQEAEEIEQSQGQSAQKEWAEQEATAAVADLGNKVNAAIEATGGATTSAANALAAVVGNTDGLLNLAVQQRAEIAALNDRANAQQAAIENLIMS